MLENFSNFNSILLVEDDEIDVMNIQRAFRKNNITYKIQIANNGLEALSFLHQTKKDGNNLLPKFILLDLNMPKMNGLEFLSEIRKDIHLHSLIVFVLTTSSDERDIKMAYQYNVAGYIVKPVDFNSLVQALKVLDNYLSICQLP
ncbi:MAG: response regulator [Acidobacteria bacterium]|nr:response regulator [Acidobacteriota bacterium]